MKTHRVKEIENTVSKSDVNSASLHYDRSDYIQVASCNIIINFEELQNLFRESCCTLCKQASLNVCLRWE